MLYKSFRGPGGSLHCHGSGGRDQAVSSSQGYSPNAANGGAGSLQGPQQYRQQGPQQAAPQDWEATGGLSPSQQQAVQELTEMGFDPRQSQVSPLQIYWTGLALRKGLD